MTNSFSNGFGIGTYGEKALHRELKWWIEPTGKYHEIPVGKYIVDIKTESGITEIQTQSFYKLRDKLSTLLTDNSVTLVYPLTREKQIIWVDKHSGEIIRTRRSNRQNSYYSAFWELSQIKPLLTSANLRLRLMLLDVAERRCEGERKKRYHKIDTTIRSLHDELLINNINDYSQLIPKSLKEPFTTRDYSIETGVNTRIAGAALNVLHFVGAIARTGKSGNAYLYSRRIIT